MPTKITEITSLTIVISTALLLIFSSVIIYFLFLYQGKKFRHQKEVMEIREAFNQILLQSKLEIQEQTLDHIAKELHANFLHLVSLININLSEILPQSGSATQENVLETKALAKQLLSELKALSTSLNTDHIMRIGFIKALDNEVARLGKTKKIHVVFIRSGEEFRIKPEHEIILFRLCQEVLNNIFKYAKAGNVTASLKYESDSFQLQISDDGIGFNKNLVELDSAEKGSTGLLNIQKRAALINAVVVVDSEEGVGTKITIIVPRPKTSSTL